MSAQFSKDQRVFLVLEYTKRRGRKGVQIEIIQELNYKLFLMCEIPKKKLFLQIFCNIALNRKFYEV